MERNIKDLKNDTFDIIIIGGGITGATLAWDASLRGYKTALIEKDDFGHATSSATSKLIHGGLRYLQNLEFGVVRESLRERRLLEKNIPHLAFPLPFIIPIYDYTPIPKFILRMGLIFYDLLSMDKNELPFSEKFLPNHQWLSKKEILEFEPRLTSNKLKGGFLYYDVLNKYPERANVEYILSAAEKGAAISNYTEFKSLILEENNQGIKNIKGVKALDKVSGEGFSIKGKIVINAAGPWVDNVLQKISASMEKKLIRSKGIHLLIPRINKDCAIAFTTRDKKHFFIIPWLNYTLLGTTDDKFKGDLDNVFVTPEEAESFLNLIKEYYPFEMDTKSIIHNYAGIRPLAVTKKDSDMDETYTVSRKHEIIDHLKTDSIKGFYSVIGGKWTTSRSLAEIVINRVMKDNKLPKVKSRTVNTPLIGGRFALSYENALQKNIQKYDQYDPGLIEHLFSYYGNEFLKLLEIISQNPKLAKVISGTRFHTVAEVEYAVKNECVVHLSDFMLRRSYLGNTGVPSLETIKEIADIIGNMLKWSKKEKEDEISEYLNKVKIRNE